MIAAVGDLHMHEHSQGVFRDMFAKVSEEANVLLICGDLTAAGLLKEAENLALDLSSCTIPVLAVLGNHDYHSDSVDEIKKILASAKVHFLEDEAYEIGEIGFAGVKGFCGGFDQYMLASFGEPAIKEFVAESINEALKLESELKYLETPKKVVVLHYSPISETLIGEPTEIFPFMGSARLAETIDRFDVAAVFHGHAHHGSPEGKTAKGIPVYNCAYELMKKKNTEKSYTIFEI